MLSVFGYTISSKYLIKRNEREQVEIMTLVDDKVAFATKVEAEIIITA
jgi:hypothetical protein